MHAYHEPVVNIMKTCINYIVVSYHGLKGNESQLGDLLHKKLYSIDKMDLSSHVPR